MFEILYVHCTVTQTNDFHKGYMHINLNVVGKKLTYSLVVFW